MRPPFTPWKALASCNQLLPKCLRLLRLSCEHRYEYVADHTSSYMRKSVNWIIVRYSFNLSICGGTSAYRPEAVMPPAPKI